MQALAELDQVTYAYSERPVLLNVSLHIHPGQFIGLIGPSGSGKTTLLRVLLGLVQPQSGQARVLGRTPHGRTPLGVGYVPQLETVDWNFPATVREVVLMGRTMHSGPWPWPTAAAKARMAAILERLGIGDLAGRHIRELSGGQQQRVFLARALVSDPQLLLLDEPTSGVDIKTRDDILHLLGDLNADGTTIVMTTHELNAAAAHLPWVVCLNRRLIAQGPPDEVFTTEVLSRTYGSEILVVRQNGHILIGDSPHSAEVEAQRSRAAAVHKEAAVVHH